MSDRAVDDRPRGIEAMVQTHDRLTRCEELLLRARSSAQASGVDPDLRDAVVELAAARRGLFGVVGPCVAFYGQLGATGDQLARWVAALPSVLQPTALFELSNTLAPGPWRAVEAALPQARRHRARVLERALPGQLEDAAALLAEGRPSGPEYLAYRSAAGAERLRAFADRAREALASLAEFAPQLEALGLIAALPLPEAREALKQRWERRGAPDHELYEGYQNLDDPRVAALSLALDLGLDALAEEITGTILQKPSCDACYHGDWFSPDDPYLPLRQALTRLRSSHLGALYLASRGEAQRRFGDRALDVVVPEASTRDG